MLSFMHAFIACTAAIIVAVVFGCKTQFQEIRPKRLKTKRKAKEKKRKEKKGEKRMGVERKQKKRKQKLSGLLVGAVVDWWESICGG